MAAADEASADEALPIRVTWHEFPTYLRHYRRNGEGFAVHSPSGRLLACMRCLQKMRVYRRRVPAHIPNEDGVFEMGGWLEQPNVVLASEDPYEFEGPEVHWENPEVYWLQHITCSTNAELEVFSEFEDSDSD